MFGELTCREVSTIYIIILEKTFCEETIIVDQLGKEEEKKLINNSS